MIGCRILRIPIEAFVGVRRMRSAADRLGRSGQVNIAAILEIVAHDGRVALGFTLVSRLALSAFPDG
jgi:hypothetical protein